MPSDKSSSGTSASGTSASGTSATDAPSLDGNSSMDGSTVHIMVNSQQTVAPVGITLKMLLDQLEIDPRRVAVEVNLDLIPREDHDECKLEEGDRVEVVTLAGGG